MRFILDTVAQLPAAEAVLATMYGVADAMASVSDKQLVASVVLADLLQSAVALEQAVQALKKYVHSVPGLSTAASEALASPAWPGCMRELLLPIVQHKRTSCCSKATAGLDAIIAEIQVSAPGACCWRCLPICKQFRKMLSWQTSCCSCLFLLCSCC